MRLEDESFCVSVKDDGKVLPANHIFFLEHENTYGILPVHKGTFFLKDYDLTFTDIKGTLEIGFDSVITPHLEGYCEGAFLSCSLMVDFSKRLDLEIKSHLIYQFYVYNKV